MVEELLKEYNSQDEYYVELEDSSNYWNCDCSYCDCCDECCCCGCSCGGQKMKTP